MGTKLNVSCSIAIIAAALFIAQPTKSDPPHLLSDSAYAFDAISFSTNEADTLASSSIFPAFIDHALPVANIADVAADVVIQNREPGSEAADRSLPAFPKRTSDDSATNAKRPGIDAPDAQLNADNVNISSLTRTNKAIAYLQKSRLSKLNKKAVARPSVASELTAVRFLPLSDRNHTTIKWPDSKSDKQKHTSTNHNHLYNFNAMLRPFGFQRGNWQDIGHGVDLGADKATKKPFIVMIDPGHGGTDPGSKGHNGLLEKDLTLDIARRVRLFLTEFPNINVELTRHHDHGLSRQSRVDAIKRSAADMVISLHFNHLPQTDVNLVESYYAGVQNIKQSLSAQNGIAAGELQRTASADTEIDLGFTEGSARLAKTLQQHIYSEVSFGNDQVQDAGVKQETLFVLTRSFTPAALIEISCLSHADEADRLASDEYRNRLAASLVDGIRNYYDSIQRLPLKESGNLGA